MVRERALSALGRLRGPVRRAEMSAVPADRPPFIHVMPDGHLDRDGVNEAAALQCALSRLCAYCAQSQGFPLVFVGPATELESGRCRRPGMHEECARYAVEQYRSAGLIDEPWASWASGSFTVERPLRRVSEEQVRFRPGPLLWSETIQPG